MFKQTTGSQQSPARNGFTECDDFGSGFVFATYGNLDAPDYIPQGSVRVHNTIKLNPQLSLAHRDTAAGCRPLGVGHDGPESVPSTLYMHKGE